MTGKSEVPEKQVQLDGRRASINVLKRIMSLASIGNADGVCNVNSESLDFAGFLTLHRQFTLDDLVRQNILDL